MVVLLTALNTVLSIFNINIFDYTHQYVKNILCLMILLCCVCMMRDRNTFLPFLGKTVFPCGLLTRRTPQNADTIVRIRTTPLSQVIYWAAEPADTVERGPKEAYKQYKNSGVTMSDSNGYAVLKVRSPTGYQVPRKDLKSHIHYRTCISNGMLGEVKTIIV